LRWRQQIIAERGVCSARILDGVGPTRSRKLLARVCVNDTARLADEMLGEDARQPRDERGAHRKGRGGGIERRRDDGLAAVFTSDLGRAIETAEIALPGSGLPVHQDWRLRECNYGELNGMDRARLDAERVRHIDAPWPNGESYRDVVGRTRSLLADLERPHDGKRILLVAHSANRLALDHLLLGRDLETLVAAPFEWQPGWEYVLEPRPLAAGGLRPRGL
jgi:broad specificity phosphatase PhoE